VLSMSLGTELRKSAYRGVDELSGLPLSFLPGCDDEVVHL